MKKILLVEDDLTLSKMLATWLGKQGYAVAVVSTVRQARKALEEDDVDLVLSDLRLQEEEVRNAKWATLDEVEAMLQTGEFIPYYPDLVRLWFAMRNHRGSTEHE